MDKEKILKILSDVENKSNKDLFEVEEILYKEHEKSKEIIVDLTKHMELIESLHNKVTKEIEKRKSK